MKIIVSVFNNLYTDQRVEKVCKTLHNEGYKIHLIGNTWDGEPHMERPYPFQRIKLRSKTLKLAYIEFNEKLYHEIKKQADKDTILLANDLDTLLPNTYVSNQLNIPLVYDSHEIFTEMPAIQGRWSQKVWRLLEKKLMPKVKYMMTESQSYADWFHEKYGIQPVVVRNIPRKIEHPISFPNNEPKIIIYQGQINPSRGLTQAIDAMKFLDNVIFKIAGDGPKRKEYEEYVKQQELTDKVKFVGRLDPESLRKFTKEADVGLSLEENGGVSYYYSLPNKVADYIQSKVPLVMINFPEMKRVYSQFKVGEMVGNHDPEMIAQKIKTVLNNGRAYYQSELEKASNHLCWEQEENKIKALYQKVVEDNF